MLYFPTMLQIITTSPSIKYSSQEVTYKSSVVLKNKEKEEKPPERGSGR